MKPAAVLMMLVLALAVVPAPAVAQSLSGAIYQAQGASVPIYFMFSVSGQTFVVAILTYGAGGNGRWFAASGATDGVSGTGQIVSPSGFVLTQPPGSTLHFQLDQPGAATGSFTTTGLGGFLSLTSGRLVRVFP
jgi:hypothetical protein